MSQIEKKKELKEIMDKIEVLNKRMEMRKKKKNKIIMIIYCISIAFVCVYVPWKQSIQPYNFSLGYSFIWSPPKLSIIDVGRVALELIGISALGGLALCFSGGFKKFF